MSEKDLTPELEAKLRELVNDYETEAKLNGHGSSKLLPIEMKMIEATDGLYEHPEWFEYPCLCDLCRSYA